MSVESAEPKVRLISVSPDAEKNILYIARVSSPNQDNEDTGLINYLIRKKHWSPFEHATMTIEFTTSRALGPQFLRHRSFTFQEFSQRYATPDTVQVYLPRRQAETNRQSSIDDLGDDVKIWFLDAQDQIATLCFSLYGQALDKDIAKECARFLLPITTTTKLYLSGTVRSWIHYLSDRVSEDTQLEHRVLARDAQQIFIEQFPTVSKALGWTAKISE